MVDSLLWLAAHFWKSRVPLTDQWARMKARSTGPISGDLDSSFRDRRMDPRGITLAVHALHGRRRNTGSAPSLDERRFRWALETDKARAKDRPRFRLSNHGDGGNRGS